MMKKIFNTKIDVDILIDTIAKTEKELISSSFKDLSNKVLKNITNKIEPVDFRQYANLKSENSKLQKKHYLVSIIEILQDVIHKEKFDIGVNNNGIYLFNGYYWEKIESERMKNFLGEVALKMKVNKFDAKLHTFKDELYKQFLSDGQLESIKATTTETTLINLLNGTFEITTTHQKLRVFDKNDFLTYILPFKYNPEADAPIFIKFLNRVLPEKELQDILAEYIGYVFIQNQVLKLEKVLILYGSGANGKSVLFSVINELLGKENISNYSLQSLTNNNGYERAMIANKLLNYASEINGKMETHFFKLLVSGEPVQVRLPYEKPYIMTNYAKFIFNANELPKEIENTNAFYRRFLIIPFNVTIPEKEQDLQLADKIIRNELSGVFNWVLKGLKRLLTNMKFSESNLIKQEVLKFREESDSVLMFITDESYKHSTNTYMLLKVLYSEYKIYCEQNGFRPVSIKNFSKRIENKGFDKERKAIGIVYYIEK